MERTFMKGCVAIAEAAVRAGCRFYAGYPITPQNDLPEHMARRLPGVGGVYIQGESEVASINMVYGAAASGTRAMTSSSSCGMSLKSEGISYIAGADVPAVICSVQRGGPGVGVIQPSQQDYFQATKAHGNGGFRLLVYAPASLQEAVDLTYQAFEKADFYRKPVMILLDGVQGTMMEPVVLPRQLTEEEVRAAKEATKTWSLNGRNGGVRHKIDSNYRPHHEAHNMHDAEIYETWKREEVVAEEYMVDDAELVIAAYGISARIALTAIAYLREQGYKVGMIRPITVFPFPYASFRKLDFERVKGVLSVEMSIPAQFAEDVEFALMGRCPMETCLRSGGEIMSSRQVVDAAVKMLEKIKEV